MTAVYGNLTGADLVMPRYLTEPHFRRFLDENRTGVRRIAGPLLLLQGEADTVIPREFIDDVAVAMCRKGVQVDYRTYPGLEHDTYPGWVVGITDGAMPDMLDWAAARFNGEPASSNCAG
jgi:alpha-beta hydrolase superfamily lysophospholipase